MRRRGKQEDGRRGGISKRGERPDNWKTEKERCRSIKQAQVVATGVGGSEGGGSDKNKRGALLLWMAQGRRVCLGRKANLEYDPHSKGRKKNVQMLAGEGGYVRRGGLSLHRKNRKREKLEKMRWL